MLQRYDIIGPIGEGTFSVVWHAWDRQTREDVALKVVFSTSGAFFNFKTGQPHLQIDCEGPDRTYDEIKLMFDLGGRDFIIEYVDCIRERELITIVMRYFKHAHFKVRRSVLDRFGLVFQVIFRTT